MYDRKLTIEQNLAMLAATPSRIADLTQPLSPVQLLTPPEPGEWSARDVLAHLRACADMWGKYIVLILNEDRPTFKAVNPTTWIKQTDYLEQEFQPSLQAFTIQRAELLDVLRPFPLLHILKRGAYIPYSTANICVVSVRLICEGSRTHIPSGPCSIGKPAAWICAMARCNSSALGNTIVK